ncbi:MAG: class I SAM-dependent methyltransferase [Actinobacteria bacterium]|nr:class I SAM-dependent methyltransferase [Actinomycetota bacterium]
MTSNAVPRYDTIGRSYSATRRTEPRIAAQIERALGDAETVVNVGAGTGSYEPPERTVVAVEPSGTMISQRPKGSAPVIQGVAEHLPFADGTFDAAMAVLTVHHWRDRVAGLRELRRVSARQVVFLFSPFDVGSYWLVDDYFPEYADLESEHDAPSPELLARHLDVQRVETIPIPGDCVDGFGSAYWNRPEAHLDPTVRAGMSFMAQMDPATVDSNVARLAAELADGTWDAKYGHLRTQETIDLGLRLVVCG